MQLASTLQKPNLSLDERIAGVDPLNQQLGWSPESLGREEATFDVCPSNTGIFPSLEILSDSSRPATPCYYCLSRLAICTRCSTLPKTTWAGIVTLLGPQPISCQAGQALNWTGNVRKQNKNISCQKEIFQVLCQKYWLKERNLTNKECEQIRWSWEQNIARIANAVQCHN